MIILKAATMRELYTNDQDPWFKMILHKKSTGVVLDRWLSMVGVSLSPDAYSLVLSLLDFYPASRMSVEAALNHPWVEVNDK